MGAKFYREPQLDSPVMICGWSGIGKVGLVAVNTMRQLVGAQRFGEIEPQGYFEPSDAAITNGLIAQMRFPATRFYSHHGPGGDLVFLVGEQQPGDIDKAYDMADEVIDVAERLGCRRIYTSAASVTTIHHTARPRIWAVPNSGEVIPEIRQYENTVLMSDLDGAGGGTITGLNGVLLGVAEARDVEAICLMGEVPYYLQGAPWPYPKASISVLELLGSILHVQLDLHELEETAAKVEANVDHILEALSHADELPEPVRREMADLRHPRHAQRGPITEHEQKEILDHIDELFKGEGGHES